MTGWVSNKYVKYLLLLLFAIVLGGGGEGAKANGLDCSPFSLTLKFPLWHVDNQQHSFLVLTQMWAKLSAFHNCLFEIFW